MLFELLYIFTTGTSFKFLEPNTLYFSHWKLIPILVMVLQVPNHHKNWNATVPQFCRSLLLRPLMEVKASNPSKMSIHRPSYQTTGWFHSVSCVQNFKCVLVFCVVPAVRSVRFHSFFMVFNLLTPNVNYSSRTAPLTSKVAFYIFIQQI